MTLMKAGTGRQRVEPDAVDGIDEHSGRGQIGRCRARLVRRRARYSSSYPRPAIGVQNGLARDVDRVPRIERDSRTASVHQSVPALEA